MSRARRTIVPVDLKEIYPEVGQYSIKFLIDHAVSPTFTSFRVTMHDRDGNEMKCDARRWGTKVNVGFDVTPSVPDGAAVIEVSLSGSTQASERFRIWIVK